jgi:ATP-dependent Clp protease protease subunit
MDKLMQLWQAGTNAGYTSALYPGVIEKVSQSERIIEVDVRAKLIEQRIIFLGEPIYPQTANIIVSQLLFLQTQNEKADIQLFINSPGGDVLSGLAIYDAMQYVKCDVRTICIGLAASMGAVLLGAGEKGKRYCLPNARVMIHQPWTSGIGGTVSDVLIEADELRKTKDKLNGIIARHTGKTMDDVEKATDRNKWLSPVEAKEFGLVDDLTGLPPELPQS